MSAKRRKVKGRVRAFSDGELAFLKDSKGRNVGVISAADLRIQDGLGLIDPSRMRYPGADGTYRGTCFACAQATDTGVALEGCLNFFTAVFGIWGLPTEQTGLLLRSIFSEMPRSSRVPVRVDGDGRVNGFQWTFRVCTACAGRASMTPWLAIGAQPELPLYRETDLPSSELCPCNAAGLS